MTMEQIYKEHSMTIYKYLLSLTHDEHLSEELTQETFYQAVRCIDKFDRSCKIVTWLCAIAKNQLLSYNRKHPKVEELESTNISTGSVEGQVLSDMSKVEILKKIHLLDDPFKEVMYLRVYGDLSFKEIGEVLSKSENWARVTFYRGKEKLKREMMKDEE
ncbi:MAG: sigma-70 family RNA polymerase sigma factor [Lachnospiraceae bacterium]|nr:sigma-70 family RNA polymerase sigma factor [Lachnospiraceae bacterium]